MSSHKSERSPSPSYSSPEPGPSRKRPRSEISSGNRKEARAHRNRIAAQNSRDRKKAQFAYLEQRVAELEEENRRLRAGSTPSEPQQDNAKDRENQELKARIATLERGLEAVVKAFSVHGAPSTFTAEAPSTSISSNPSSHSATLNPVDTSAPTTASHPVESSSSATPTHTTSFSPTPSHTSDIPQFTFTTSTSSTPLRSESQSQSTRHLARMATIPPPGELELDSTYRSDGAAYFPAQDFISVDDPTMEAFFREILCDSRSTSPSTEARSKSVSALDLLHSSGQTQGAKTTAPAGSQEMKQGTEVDMLGMGMDMASLEGFGVGLGIDMSTEGTSGLVTNETIVSTSGGFTATWLGKYDDGQDLDYNALLQGLESIPVLQSDSSAASVTPLDLGSSGVQVA
ncbi:hypothetical protein VNI00_009384 [Paramarasmius palmivorus]|uniref:X-box-binding protein 1 n=1 Tax=Paramarasmius palmivorus TaxID=297713 RepID=A0AAW0CR54_9AGAR